jgi:hypothetical protein
MPNAIVDITKIILDIAAECSGSLHGDAGRRCVRQSIIGLEAIGIFY